MTAKNTAKKSASKSTSTGVSVVLGDLSEHVNAFGEAIRREHRMSVPRSVILRRLIADGLAHNGIKVD